MASREIRAGAAFVELLTKDVSLGKGLTAAQAKLKAFANSANSMGDGLQGAGKKFAAIGGAAVGGLVGMAAAFANIGSELNDMAARTGMSVENLSQLKFAANQTGASLEDVEAAGRKMAKTIAGADDESKAAKKSLGDLGFTVDDLAGKSPDKQFEAIAKRLGEISDPTRRAAVAMEVFGKSGTKLLPMIGELGSLRKRADELGQTWTGPMAAAADALGDKFDEVKAVFMATSVAIGGALAPVLTVVSDKIINAVVVANGWIAAHQGVIVTALKVAAGVAALGGGLFAAGLAFKAVSVAIIPLNAVLAITKIAILGVGVALSVLSSPVGLVTAALVAGGVAWLTYSETGQSALASLKDDGLQAFGAIRDALAAGDISAAASVLWALLKLEWTKGTNFLLDKWEDLKLGIVTKASDAFYGVLAAWEIVRHSLTSAWITVTKFFGDVWDGMVGSFLDAWNFTVNGIMKAYNEMKGFFGDFDATAANNAIDQGEADRQLQRTRKDMGNYTDRQTASDTAASAELERNKKVLKGISESSTSFLDMAKKGTKAAKANLDSAIKLEAAQAAFRRSVEAARAAAAGGATAAKPLSIADQIREMGFGNSASESGAGRFRQIAKQAREARDRFNNSASETTSRGTFSVFAAAGMGGNSGVDKQQLKKQEEIEKNTAKTNDLLGRYIARASTYGA